MRVGGAFPSSMHSPTGGNQFLIAQNGPINAQTAEADAFTSALREIVAAKAGATSTLNSMAAPSAATQVSRTVTLLEIFDIGNSHYSEVCMCGPQLSAT